MQIDYKFLSSLLQIRDLIHDRKDAFVLLRKTREIDPRKIRLDRK